ncbi:MAG: 4Fe-4S binding protein, partial [Oscillospiraceae bacterium]|nr:4Fe-4S binding protein [Oscillospiraceae bacterium]
MQKKRDRIIKTLIRIICWIFFGDSFALSLSAIKMLISALMNHSSASVTGPLLILAATIPTAVLFGRYYCGYICSFGAMQGLFSFAGSKVIKMKKRLLQKADRYLSYLPFVVLALIIAFQILGITAMASISPFTAFGKMFIPKGEHDFSQFLTAGGIILALIIIASFFIHRPFCSYLCPMGAVYKLSSMLSARIRIPVSRRKCRSCGECSICSSHCKKERISYPALIGTIAVFVLVSLLSSYVMEKSYSSFKAPLPEDEKGPYADGSFEGTGKGYRGNIGLIVTTENGYITDITVSASREA